MQIIALLSWWDEQPGWLTRTIVPLARFCTHLVAVDGAYQHIGGSGEQPASPSVQADAVLAACDAAGLALTLHRPTEPWIGDEVAKRTFLFRLADLTAREGDWLFVIDADETVSAAPRSLHEQLEQAAADGVEAATVHLAAPPERAAAAVRRFFRWDPTLRVVGRHSHYAAGPDDQIRLLWGPDDDPRTVPARHIDGFRLEHWTRERHPFRRQIQVGYYQRRRELRLEHDV